MSARILVLLALGAPALLVAACGGAGATKPLPNLPPPEYEAPRAFDAGGIDDLPGAEPAPPAAVAPTPTPSAPAGTPGPAASAPPPAAGAAPTAAPTAKPR